ncbi:hypothetical protein JOB18_033605 [Solea senegalensis]|uniref:Uncharacterized protein n=1 Tax=Solea senegalensis TaxID=28829 RepID=A0AAV6SHG9_SOLSE|nr:hypothetical protein JOB18_033605 [Solea senegalensis]
MFSAVAAARISASLFTKHFGLLPLLHRRSISPLMPRTPTYMLSVHLTLYLLVSSTSSSPLPPRLHLKRQNQTSSLSGRQNSPQILALAVVHLARVLRCFGENPVQVKTMWPGVDLQ